MSTDTLSTNEKSQKLAKVLAHAGVASRRAAEELILAGKVSVNGTVEKNVARRVDPATDKISVKGRALPTQSETLVLSLYKPVGVVSTTHDPDGKPTVLQYLPEEYKKTRLYPVGRLDEESEGLVLLTNDGELAYRLTHPKFEVPRTYQVWISGLLTASELHRLRTGVPLKDGYTQPADVQIVNDFEAGQMLKITLSEGRHHQIRRMMQAVNHPVQKLKRVSHGKYQLGTLKPGEVRLETTTK